MTGRKKGFKVAKSDERRGMKRGKKAPKKKKKEKKKQKSDWVMWIELVVGTCPDHERWVRNTYCS